MDVTWKDLLVLLQGKTNICGTCNAILEVIEFDLVSLPDIFHSLAFELLVSDQSNTRANASLLVGKLALKFRSILVPLVCDSSTDGELLQLEDISICTILATPGSHLLSKATDHACTRESGNDVYTVQWLQKQKAELKTRLGLDTDVVAAIGDIADSFLHEEDVTTCNTVQSELAPSNLPYRLHSSLSAPTEESWLARIVRCMIVGLLSPRWETRHGYSQGLSQLLSGLFPNLINTQLKPVTQIDTVQNGTVRYLPEFVCNDILCCGLCVLLLDRFVDFGCSTDSSGAVAPVKEVAGVLISCAMQCSSSSVEKVELLWGLLCEMAMSPEHWTVALGGYIGLKSFAPFQFSFILTERWVEFVDIMSHGVRAVRSSTAEITTAACDALSAFSAAALQCGDALSSLHREHYLPGLQLLLQAFHEVLSYVISPEEDPLSAVVWTALSEGLGGLVALYTKIVAECAAASQRSACLMLCLQNCREILGKLYLYNASTRRRCLGSVSSCFEALTSMTQLQCLPFTDHSIILDEISNLLGALCAAGCLTSQRPVVELLLEDAPSSAGVKQSKRRSKSTSVRVTGLDEDALPDQEGNDPHEKSQDAQVGLETAVSDEELVAVHHYLSEREVWGRLTSSWTALAFVHFVNRGSPTRDADEKFPNFIKFAVSSVQSILSVAIRCFEMESTSKRVSPAADGNTNAGHIFESAAHSFCACEMMRRPLESFTASGNKLFLLADLDQFDFLSVIVQGLCSTDAGLPSFVLEAFRTELRECVVKLTSSHLVAAVPASSTVTLTAAIASDVTPPSQLHGSGGSALPKKRAFRFVVVPDTVEPARKKQVVSVDVTGSRAVGSLSKSSCASTDNHAIVAGKGRLWLSRLFCLFNMELRAFTGCTSHSEKDVAAELLRYLEDVKLYCGHSSSCQQTVALLKLALAGSSVDTMAFFVQALPNSVEAEVDAQLQLFVAFATARGMLSHASAANDFPILWKLFERGRTAERFASQLTYILAKTQPSRFADQCAELFQRSGTQPIAVEKVLGSALLACTPSTRAALNARYDVVGLVLDAAGAVEKASALEGDRIPRLAEVLCLLFQTETSEGDTDDVSLPPSLLPATAARLYLRLFDQCLPKGQAATVVSRNQLAELLSSLTSSLLEQVVGAYEILFATALRGLGDREAGVRRACVRVFRQLVPLAALAKQTSCARRVSSSMSGTSANTSSNEVHLAVEKASELLQHIFTKQSPFRIQKSHRERDLNIMKTLTQCTNLVAHHDAALAPAQLRDYQWDGVSWLTQLRRFGLNGILADEMGLGKSLQALTALAVLRIEKDMQSAPFLVVCPASVVMHWEDEIKKYFPPSLLRPVRFASNIPAASVAVALKDGATVMVVSYELMRRDVTSGPRSVLKTTLWETVVLDEAHLIKNPAAGITKAACSLQSLHRMALTGTPVQNQVEELWSLMNFLLPDYIGNYKLFRKDVVNPIQRSFAARRELRLGQQQQQRASHNNPAPTATMTGKGNNKKDDVLAKFHQAIEISSIGLSLLRTLHKQVLPFILRRSKEMVARDLPSKTVIDLLCPLSKEQRQLYAAYQERLHTSDDALEQEFIAAKDSTAGEFHAEELTEFDLACTELAIKTAQTQTEALSKSQNVIGAEGWGSSKGSTSGKTAFTLPSFDDDEEPKEVKPPQSKLHAFEALNYLKLLCLHPALVVDNTHSRFRARLLQSTASSGKLIRLAALLLESGVVAREEFNPALRIDDLLELDGELMGQHAASVNSDDDSASEEEEDSAAAGENADSTEAPSTDKDAEKSNGQRGKKRPVAKADESKAPTAVAEHIEATLSEQLVVPLHRCLIFAQHRAALDLVEEQVLGRYFPSIGYERLDGSMDPLKRSTIARKFNNQQRHGQDSKPMVYRATADDDKEETEALRAQQVAALMTALPAVARDSTTKAKQTAEERSDNTDCDIRILLMTTRSCGLGLNLTAADTVIFLEHDWNPFADLQAMDRVHRLGQTQPVSVYRLLAESTVEARIMRLQDLKQGIASQIINEENAGGASVGGGDSGDGEGDGEIKKVGPQFGSALFGSLLLRPDAD